MSIKILVVDDERIILNILVNCLEGLGYDVLTAHNGLEALEIAKKEFPTVIVSDIMMPVMDGFELCKKVREHNMLKDTPFIVLTGRDSKVDILKGFETGVNDYIVKPLYASEIICRVKAFVNLRLNQLELLKKNEIINKHQKALEEMNKKLELKVEERTRELNETNKRLTDLLKEKEELVKKLESQVQNVSIN